MPEYDFTINVIPAANPASGVAGVGIAQTTALVGPPGPTGSGTGTGGVTITDHGYYATVATTAGSSTTITDHGYYATITA